MRSCVFIAALCFFALVGAAETMSSRLIPVGGHGTLEMTMPADWLLVQTNQPDKPALGQVRAPSNHIVMEFTVYWDGFPTKTNAPGDAQFQQIISNVVSVQYVPVSAEKAIKMEKLKGAAVSGWFVRFTDARWFAQRKPPAEFNNVTTGMFRCGNLWGNFNLLTDDKDGPQFKEGRRVLESIRPASKPNE